ncbi:MAG: metalloenzyme domain-containing protein [Anaerolineae bacterium]|nr:metalloenzyme domain-containing protein [Anaerolineae bacterium]
MSNSTVSRDPYAVIRKPITDYRLPITDYRYVHIFFMDGVGMGAADPEINPFVRAHMPYLTGLFSEGWYVPNGRVVNGRATLIPTDANLGLPGRPQSATGQAAILTGRNAPQLVGEHYGPKPNQPVRDVIAQGTLFAEVTAVGGRAALLSPYPQRYFDSIESGKRLYSSVPLAATEAGLALMTAEDLRHGRAVSPDFTGQGWREYLGYADIPVYTPYEAGQQLARLARGYHFSFFEHWPSDRAGHRGSLAEAAQHLELLDAALGGLIETWHQENADGLLIITSDHGNIEEKGHRQHTRNPVPTILAGPGHAELAAEIHDLTDIAKVVRRYLQLRDRRLEIRD